jgi:hypothetical protein
LRFHCNRKLHAIRGGGKEEEGGEVRVIVPVAVYANRKSISCWRAFHCLKAYWKTKFCQELVSSSSSTNWMSLRRK